MQIGGYSVTASTFSGGAHYKNGKQFSIAATLVGKSPYFAKMLL